MPSVTLDFNRLSAQVHDLAVLSRSNDPEQINVDELIEIGEHLVEALAHIRFLQNVFSPINRLPPEVLANIISYIQYDLPVHSPGPFPLPEDLNKWAEMLAVCRHWRRTLINAPSLWSQIHLYRNDSVDSAARSRTWLSRAHDVPLKIYLTGFLPGGREGEDDTTEFPVDVFAHVRRLKELHISSEWTHDSIFWKLVDQPARNLESFSFMMNQEDQLGDHFTILPRVFQDDMPKLKNLTLGNVSAWPHNRFSNLTRFRLHDQPSNSRATLAEFLEFLAASPKLEELVLVHAGPSLNGDDSANAEPPVVALPCLQYLEIGWPDQWRVKGRHLQMFLKHLAIPPTATRCFFEGGTNPLIGYHLMQEGYEHLKQMREVTKTIVMTAYNTKEGYESFIGLNDSTLYCNYTNGTPVLTPPSTTILWENVEELIYAPPSTWGLDNFMASLLGQLPSLRRLTISGSMWCPAELEEVARALQELDVERKKFTYAPLLEELYVYPIEDESQEQTEEGGNLILMICNVRANNGRALKKVVLDCFPDESLEMLKDYFDEVEASGERAKGFSMDDTFRHYWRSYGHFKTYVQCQPKVSLFV